MNNHYLIKNVQELSKHNGIYKIQFEDMKIDISLNINEKSDYIFFCFAGAKPLDRVLPYFNRWKWSDIFHSNIVSISDYTLELSKELQIGWYQNNGGASNFKKLANFIKEIAQTLGYSERSIIIYGSSAGGFATLKCSQYLPLAKCIAINAQTDISKYYKTYYDLLMKYLTKFHSGSEKVGTISENVLLVQNIQDSFHYRRHYTPFIEKFPSTLTYVYSHENGHSAEPKEIIPHIILKALEKDNHFETSAINISFKQLEIANLANQNWVDEKAVKFLPQGRKDLKAIEFGFPIDWNMDPLKDKNWKFQLNMWRFFDKNLYEYSLNKDIKNIIPLRNVLCSWYDFHIEKKLENDFLSEDMAIGGRAMRLAYYMSADTVYIENTPDYKKIISKILMQHIILLTDFNNVVFSNHTLTDIHGLMALSKFLKPFSKSIVDNFIDLIFPKLLNKQFSDDGFHKENSPEYHFFAIKCFDALKRSQWFEKYDLSNILNKALKNRDIFYLPDGRILPFGDSSNSARSIEKNPKFGLQKPEIFHEAGYFIYRENTKDNLLKNSSYFSIMAGLRSRFHKQNDDLSFIWFEGEDIIRDFGKFAYKRDKFRNYAVSTESHNSLKFNDINIYNGNDIIEDQFFHTAIQDFLYKDGKLEVNSEIAYISENVPELNRGINHKRNFSYIPSKQLTITDEIESQQQSLVKQFFHFSPQWVIQSVSTNIIILNSMISGAVLHITVDTESMLSLYYGSIEPLQGWSSVEYSVAKPSVSILLEWKKNQKKATTNFKLYSV